MKNLVLRDKPKPEPLEPDLLLPRWRANPFFLTHNRNISIIAVRKIDLASIIPL